MRIKQHPILEVEEGAKVAITVNGEKILAREGEPILAALLAHGLRITRYTPRLGEARGLFCGIGRCTDCLMTVNKVPNVRTCITPVQEGMDIVIPNDPGKGDSHA